MRIVNFVLITISFVFLIQCQTPHTPHTPHKYLTKGKYPVKNVIIMVPDGFGPSQLSYAHLFKKYTKIKKIRQKPMYLDVVAKNGNTFTVINNPYNTLVTDSAAAATQIATGHFTRSELLGLDKDGNVVPTLLERAKQFGKSTGLVSDTEITHATPAAFAAHIDKRTEYNTIAEQILKTGPDVLLSGGLQYFLPKDTTSLKTSFKTSFKGMAIPPNLLQVSNRDDNKNLILDAVSKSYDPVFTKGQMLKSKSNKILGLFTSGSMPDGIWVNQHRNNPKRQIPNLGEMTKKAIEVLSRDEDGFFLMIEGGQIDYAGHYNDAALLLHEILNFDEALGYVYNWAKKRNDTLVIVISDHDTGGFGFSYISDPAIPKIVLKNKQGKRIVYKPHANYGKLELLDRIYKQQISFQKLFARFNNLPKVRQTPTTLMNMVNKNIPFSITLADAKRIIKKSNSNLLTQAISNQQHVVWSSGGHTSTALIAYAFGPGSNIFKGTIHNTQISDLIKKLASF